MNGCTIQCFITEYGSTMICTPKLEGRWTRCWNHHMMQCLQISASTRTFLVSSFLAMYHPVVNDLTWNESSNTTSSLIQSHTQITMAPGLTDSQPTAPHKLQKDPVKAVFPHGIETSGQHPPLYHHLRPFGDFPQEIIGPTVWNSKDYVNNREQWIHKFSVEEVSEMSTAADDFLATGRPLTGISKVGVYIMYSRHNQLPCIYRTTSASQSFPNTLNQSDQGYWTEKASSFSKASQ